MDLGCHPVWTYYIPMVNIQAALNLVLNQYSHLLGDVGKEVALPGKPKQGWQNYSDIFCDNLVVWCMNNHASTSNNQGRCIAAVREAFKMFQVSPQDIKSLGQGRLWEGNTYIPKSATKAYKRKCGDLEYTPGYISVKITLRELPAVEIISQLPGIMEELERDYIYLHDLDMATDCQHVTSRAILQDYLRNLDADTPFVEDRHKVGDHCLSWMSTTHKQQEVRNKVYNKFVQMLESAQVRTSLGSRLEELVASSDDKFTQRLLAAKHTGLSRLELTFYGSKVRPYKYYTRVLDKIKEQLQECLTYKVPYSAYWKYMVRNMPSMVGVYIPSHHTFAYCHWWNSVTGKKYGSHRGKISKEEAMTLLANYSFNDRPIYLVEICLDDADEISSTALTTYTRPVGCKAITLVAGGHKGLYPYKYSKGVLDFPDVGLVPYKNITIKWPTRRIRKGDPPLVRIMQQGATEEYIHVHDTAVHVSTYSAGYVVLEINHEYTICEVSKHQYRGKDTLFAITTGAVHIRCGNSLGGLLQRWLDKHPKGKAPYMGFKTTTKRKVHGVWDILVV